MTDRERLTRILEAYPPSRESLIPVLQETQTEFGYLPSELMPGIAAHVGVSPVALLGVASFYNQFRFVPPGKHPIKVCLGTACHMRGGNIILDSWERELKIKVGETTPDRQFSLERVACIGCCAMAPVVVVEDKVTAKVSPTKVMGILLSYRIDQEKKAATGGDS